MSSPGSRGTGGEALPDGVGPFRVLRLLGAGGMGEVYLAERLQPRQLVALKVIKLGMDTRSVLARFEIEREAMAMMSHTCIARMLDAGVTERGQPYFAMEYVPGLPLTDYCARKRLGVEGRLQLFLQVCEAVQHAHQKGVIHRDLKPGNILVMEQDDKPVPKIIDFGLARAVDQTRWTHTLVSQEGRFLGTLPYMSPEQADEDALDVDTRTDIYSLGVILYELLTGEPPFTLRELQEAGKLGVLRILREKEPPTPSQRVGSGSPTTTAHADVVGLDLRALRRRVRGDLDCIALCALEKDRTKRYPSVSALAANIRRHLRHEVVEPASPGFLYRLRKWTRRHRRGVAVGGLVAASLLAMASIWALKQLEFEAEQAERIEAQKRTILASDPALLSELARQADEDLWPLQPELRSFLDTWLERAKTLEERLPEHQDLLEELTSDAGMSRARETRFRHRRQEEFLVRLRVFLEAQDGAVSSVRRRLEQIDDLEHRSITGESARARWREELAELRDSGRYPAELELEPIFGLLPLGPDPESGLWLFAHLQSGSPAERDAEGRFRLNEESGVVFVLVPGGTLAAGGFEDRSKGDVDQADRLPWPVAISPFLLSKFELTQAQWQRIAGYNPSNFRLGNRLAGGPLHPVERVNLDECTEELRKFGMGLPTDGQWEYACRASTPGLWFCQRTALGSHVNLADSSVEVLGWPCDPSVDDGYRFTAPVGSLEPNPWGFCDILGNVREWMANAWTPSYEEGLRDGDGWPIEALGIDELDIGVTRGGAYSEVPGLCTVAVRMSLSPTNREVFLGVRPVFPLPE